MMDVNGSPASHTLNGHTAESELNKVMVAASHLHTDNASRSPGLLQTGQLLQGADRGDLHLCLTHQTVDTDCSAAFHLHFNPPSLAGGGQRTCEPVIGEHKHVVLPILNSFL